MEPTRRHLSPAPLIPAAIALMAGILLGRYIGASPGIWAALWFAATLAAIVTARRKYLAIPCRLAVAAGLVGGGAALATLAFTHIPNDHILAFMPPVSSPLATLTGRVASVPRVEEDDRQFFRAYETPGRTRFLLDTEAVSTLSGPAQCQGLVRVQVNEPVWDLQPGKRVRIACRLYRPRGPTNPGQSDNRQANRRNGIFVHATAPASDAIERIDGDPPPLASMLWRLRTHASQHLQTDTDYSGRLLLRSLIIGGRHRKLAGVNDAMVRSGTAHFLSISGLHLGVLLGFFYLILRLLQVPARRTAMIVLAMLGVYLLVAEPRTPLLRASIMSAAFCLAVILGRSANAANLLAAAAIVLLLAQPMELFRPGFQLSFGIVAGILLMFRPVQDLLFGRWLNVRGLMVFRDDQRARRWFWHNAFVWTTRMISVSVAAYLAALPLVAYHFGLLTPLAPAMTLLLFPLVALALVAGYVQLAFSALLPNLAGAMSPAVGMFVGWLEGAAGLLGRMPWLSIDLMPVPVWATVLLSAAILATAYRTRLRLSRAWAAVCLAGVVTVVVATTQLPASASAGRDGRAGAGELLVMDVRHGNCLVFRAPSGSTYLFDAGTLGSFDPDAAVLEPLFRQRRWPQPAGAFVSHANLDHYNALPGLLKRHRLGRAFLYDGFSDFDEDAGAARLLREFDRAGTKITHIHRGQMIRLDDATTVTVLWPPAPRDGYAFDDANDSSLVLRLECNGVRMLIPGDIQELSQRMLLELRRDELKADVLLLPHHGGFADSLPEFIEAVDPEIVIRSSEHRRTGVTDRITGLTVNREFYATNLNGCVTVKLEDHGAKVTTQR